MQLGLDPGNVSTGYCILHGSQIGEYGEFDNKDFSKFKGYEFDLVAIEKPEARGTSLGKTTLETIFYAGFLHGYFQEALGIPTYCYFPKHIRTNICGRPNAKDVEVALGLQKFYDFSYGRVTKATRKNVHLNSHEYNALGVLHYHKTKL